MAKIRRQNAPRRLQDAILVGFCRQNEAKLEPSWYKIRMRQRSYVKIAWKQKTAIFPI